MLKNNIIINNYNKKNFFKYITRIIKKIKIDRKQKIFFLLKNKNFFNIKIFSINKKCIITNKKKKLFKHINISRWVINKTKFKLNINKW